MIAEECFTEKWLQELRRRYPLASPQILEKALYAFDFLGLLARSGHPFVFKGGTALILILPELKRLSIDVDIVGNIPLDILARAIQGSRFTKMEDDVRKGAIPAAHVKFFYNSLFVPPVNGGDNDWGNTVRGILVDFYARGIDPETAHEIAYGVATNRVGILNAGWGFSRAFLAGVAWQDYMIVVAKRVDISSQYENSNKDCGCK